MLATLGVDWIEGQLTAGLSLVGPGTDALGGIVDLQLGLRLAPRLGDVRPFLSIGAGVGFTGPLTRPVGSVSAGLEIALGSEWSLAPEVSLLHDVQDDGPRQSDDALLASYREWGGTSAEPHIAIVPATGAISMGGAPSSPLGGSAAPASSNVRPQVGQSTGAGNRPASRSIQLS